MQDNIKSRIQEIKHDKNSNVKLFIKREDEIHPFISGNKYRKLKYNLIEAKERGQNTLLTFGGAFSNHIAAVSYAGKHNGFKTIGVIRGDELEGKTIDNPTLHFAKQQGMKLQFISREDYKRKAEEDFITKLKEHYGDFYLLPEGGTNELAVKGCEEILNSGDDIYDFIVCSVGTGGTVSGLINATESHQKVIGFSALKGDFLKEDIRKFAKKLNWVLNLDYHFGGYAKIKSELVTFINDFKLKYNISLDPIYTGKMTYGIFDLIEKSYFPSGSKVLIIHTGGLQGIKGVNDKLKTKNMPQILV